MMQNINHLNTLEPLECHRTRGGFEIVLGIEWIHKFAFKAYENLSACPTLGGQSFVNLQLFVYLLKFLFSLSSLFSFTH